MVIDYNYYYDCVWQTIPFSTDAEEERNLLRELKLHMAAADCPYIVKFFGAFYIDVSYFSVAVIISACRTNSMHIFYVFASFSDSGTYFQFFSV